MNILLTICHIPPSAYVKSLSKTPFPKALFSFLLIASFASFLASCLAEEPVESTSPPTDIEDVIITLSLEDCPADQLTLVEGIDNTFTWTNPTGPDFIITSIFIVTTGDTENEDLPELETNSTSATLPAGSYSVTITAESTEDTSVTDTCNFSVIITLPPPPITVMCPENAVAINLLIAGTPIPLSTHRDVIVTTANVKGTATLSYDPENITPDNLEEPSVTVTVTATDSADSAIDTCTFTVDVTQNTASTSFMSTTIDCAARAPESMTLDPVLGDIVLSTTITSGIIASNNGAEIASPTFSFDPPTISEASTVSVTVTVLDPDGNVATSPDDPTNEASCTFDFTALPTPRLIACPTGPFNGLTNSRISWTPPTVENLPTGARLVVTSSPPNQIDMTGATFTTANIYQITFQLLDENDRVVRIGSTMLACPSFRVIITEPQSTALPANSRFVLLSNDFPPSPENPFLIRDSIDLGRLSTVINDATINEFSNINGSGASNYREAAYLLTVTIELPDPEDNATSNFTPIGIGSNVIVENTRVTMCENTCFEGTFNGNNNTISNLQYTGDSLSNVGFFGVINGSASISNLTLSSPMITNNNRGITAVGTGALVGTVLDSNSTISKVAVLDGAVQSAGRMVGGLVGDLAGTIMNSAATTTVTANGSVGGLVGSLTVAGEILASYAAGAVTGTNNSIGVGGLVGQTQVISKVGLDNGGAIIYNSYATGSVTAQGTGAHSVGGLIGGGQGINILHSYARGSVTCPDRQTDCLIGGLKGGQSTSGIRQSYWDTVGTGIAADSPASSSNLGIGSLPAVLMPTAFAGDFSDWDETSLAVTIDAANFTATGGQWRFEADRYPGLAGNAVTIPNQPLTLTVDTPQ